MELDPRETAVVLIEYQNDFTSDGGALHGAVSDVMESTGMLANTGRAVARARDAGATIIHAPISFAEGYGEISETPYGILAGVVESNAFVKGSWGAEIIDELAPEKTDIVVEGKRGLDTFASTNLDFILRSRGIRNVALGGFLTNCCVESTMRSAYEKGFNVFTLTDCVAATSQEEHDNAIAKDYPMFSHPVSSQEFLGALAGEQLTGRQPGVRRLTMEFLAPTTWADALAARSEHPGRGADRRRHRRDGRAQLRPAPAGGAARPHPGAGAARLAAHRRRWRAARRGGHLRAGDDRAGRPGARAGDGLAHRGVAADPGPRHGRRQPRVGVTGRRRAPGAARRRRGGRGRVGPRVAPRSRSPSSSPASSAARWSRTS